MKAFVLSFLFLAVAYTEALVFSDCGSTTGKFSHVTVSNCDESADRCIFKKGTSVHVEVDFQSLTDSNSANIVIHGVIKGVPLPFPFPQSDACKYGALSCPLKKDQTYKYALDMPIKNEYPSLELDVKLELQDDSSKDIFCVLIPSKLE